MKRVIIVSKTAKDIMKDVCILSLEGEYHNISNLNISNIVYQSLSVPQIDQLARKISLLPSEYSNILFFRYCFKSTPLETNKVMGIEDSISTLRYVQKMLSGFMELEGCWIDDKSMERACEIALAGVIKDYENTEVLDKPKYSKTFRIKLKDMKIKRKPNKIPILVAKRVAVFLMVSILSLSAILVANAEARENVLSWVIETFPKFSIFTPQIVNEDNNSVELTSLKIKYIPIGFELIDIHEGRQMLIYNYLADNDQRFDVKLFTLASQGKSYYDTENSDIEEITFKGSTAYTWQTDKITYLIWYQDGIECHISGNLNKDEILKIAENILK